MCVWGGIAHGQSWFLVTDVFVSIKKQIWMKRLALCLLWLATCCHEQAGRPERSHGTKIKTADCRSRASGIDRDQSCSC